ncbi:MAG: gliding motility-associated C-terminal domain-containing protein [Bacteroidia bacterium]
MKNLLAFLATCYLLLATASAQDVSTFAGTAGVSGSTEGSPGKFNAPSGVCVDASGTVYIADRYNNKIRKITVAGVVSTLAGSGIAGGTDGTGALATFNEPLSIACDNLGNLYVTDYANNKIRKVVIATGVVTTFAGTGAFGTTNGAANVASFGSPTGIAVTNDGSIVYVSDYTTHTIRKIQGGMVTTFAGTAFSFGSTNGIGAAARFFNPRGLCLDNSSNVIVADEGNNMIRKITPAAVVTTIAGTGVPGSGNGNVSTASFNSPFGVEVDASGNIYVGDGDNYTIRKITTAGTVSVYAGITGTAGYTNGPVSIATFGRVTALAFSNSTNCFFVADPENHLIRKVCEVSSVILTLTSNSPNNTFCTGANVVLTASPPGLTNYSFYQGATLLGTSATGTITLTGLSIGVHNIYCTAVDALGLPTTSSPINITIVAGATATITPSGTISLCVGDSALLTASAGISFQWNTGAITQSIYAKNAGSYTVTVTVNGGCSAQSSPVTITLKPMPASVQATNDTVCPGQSGLINAVPQAGVTYYWFAQSTGGSLLYTGSAFSSPPVSQTTPFYIELHGNNGCVNPARFVAYVIVDQKPVASFDVSLPASASSGIQMFFYNTTTNGYTYSWDFGDPTSNDNTSTSSDPTHIYTATGEYTIQLIATNAHGCSDTTLKTIIVAHNHTIFIPTTFTPNNDGINDIFRVRGSNIKTVSMSIFNQWGQQIYHSEENSWDGSMKGDVVQNGTYVYQVAVTYQTEATENFKGQITVIR